MINDDIVLECTRCEADRDYERESDTVVRCEECGKRHSMDSLEWRSSR